MRESYTLNVFLNFVEIREEKLRLKLRAEILVTESERALWNQNLGTQLPRLLTMVASFGQLALDNFNPAPKNSFIKSFSFKKSGKIKQSDAVKKASGNVKPNETANKTNTPQKYIEPV